MKKYIKSYRGLTRNYRYEIYRMGANGYVLAGRAKDENDIERVVRYIKDKILNNPMMSDDERYSAIHDMYIWDSETNETWKI